VKFKYCYQHTISKYVYRILFLLYILHEHDIVWYLFTSRTNAWLEYFEFFISSSELLPSQFVWRPSVRLLTFSFKQLLLTNYSSNFNKTDWGMGIQICSNTGAGPFWSPIRGKIRKILLNLQKSSSHEPLAGML